VIHEGTRLRVLEQMGDWARIELEDGRQGWVALNEIVFVY
ncbi:MAG TPA: ion channel protein, partial [Rikenellaceae bacterium]|nr:ion channel protein [Rikenellaceae bacterium]